MSRYRMRRVMVGATLSVALIFSVAAATTVSGAPSRASNRWNHVAKPPASVTQDGTDAATDAGGEPPVHGPIWRTLHLVEQFSPRFTFVDAAPRGDSPGDYGVFRDNIATNDGVRIGTIDAQCIAAYADQCSGSIRIPGRGQITFAGITPIGVDPDHYAITGGTGQFAGVGGALLIEFLFIDEAKLTVYLTR